MDEAAKVTVIRCTEVELDLLGKEGQPWKQGNLRSGRRAADVVVREISDRLNQGQAPPVFEDSFEA